MGEASLITILSSTSGYSPNDDLTADDSEMREASLDNLEINNCVVSPISCKFRRPEGLVLPNTMAAFDPATAGLKGGHCIQIKKGSSEGRESR